MAEDWIEQLLRDFQDRITGGLYHGIYQLPETALDRVMECQADACVKEFVKLYDLPADLDLDGLLERMKTGGPSRIKIQRNGASILWEEQHEGQCMCPLVKRDVIPLQPTLCRCGVHWLRMLIERHARRGAQVELIESVATGARSCVFRITFPGP